MSPSRHESVLRQRRSLAARLYRLANKPYYVYRPRQLARRVRAWQAQDGDPRLLTTAWGSQLYCWPDPLGHAVARTGVYDLAVAETLARLADAGETALDAGANVGLMSNLLAHAVGPGGRVVAFEPHPAIVATLTTNAERWRTHERFAPVEVRAAAVSSAPGTVMLAVDPAAFARNKGTASLERLGAGEPGIEVQATRIEDEFDAPIGTLKLDVEGHERSALQGASALLDAGLIRDIVFEEHGRAPTPVTELLESHGYTLFGVVQGMRGPIVCAPAQAYERKLWDPPALLATRDPERARARLRPRGWRCLRGRFD
jgi:FkbM family methyltransferase